jgi:Domain of unknown function (DUF6894)
MSRFYFHLSSSTSRIPDETGKELGELHAAYEHGRKLIKQIIYHVGSDDSEEWKVVVSNEIGDALLIIPFPRVDSEPEPANGCKIQTQDA